jgi:hypothetical protein
MNKQEFINEMEKIEIAYKKKFSQDEYRLWFKEFMTTDLKEFEKAIDKTIKEVKFIPKIADVRSRIAINPNDYYINDPYAYLYKNLEWCELVKE